MNIKRAFLALAVMLLLLPGLAMAGHSTAIFEVTLDFHPNAGAPSTTANLTCDFGDPRQDSIFELAKDDAEKFKTVKDWDGINVCTVSVVVLPGFIATYTGVVTSGTGLILDDGIGDPCVFQPTSVAPTSSAFRCDVELNGISGKFEVTKVWEGEEAGGDSVDGAYSMTLICTEAIISSSSTAGIPSSSGTDINENDFRTWSVTSTSTLKFSVTVDTTGILPKCWAVEVVSDSSVASDASECSSPLEVGPGEEVECDIINTVFFEGIPTLNQYGLAIMALLMLGVGFVGFRRFV